MESVQKKSFDFSIESLLRIDQNKELKSISDLGVQYAEDSYPMPVTSFAVSNGEAGSSWKSEIRERSLGTSETFSWLHCTRFKPPKLPRSRKRGNLGKRIGRGPRIPFSPNQIAILEDTFSNSQYLSSDCINRLANTLHLSETRVKIWFQNRRARFRREKDARDGSTLGQCETTESVSDAVKDGGIKISQGSKSFRKQDGPTMRTGDQFLGFKGKNSKVSTTGETSIAKEMETDYLKNNSSTLTALSKCRDFQLFNHQLRPPLLIADPRLAHFQYLSKTSRIGFLSLMKLSEDPISGKLVSDLAASPYPNNYQRDHLHSHQPPFY